MKKFIFILFFTLIGLVEKTFAQTASFSSNQSNPKIYSNEFGDKYFIFIMFVLAGICIWAMHDWGWSRKNFLNSKWKRPKSTFQKNEEIYFKKKNRSRSRAINKIKRPTLALDDWHGDYL